MATFLWMEHMLPRSHTESEDPLEIQEQRNQLAHIEYRSKFKGKANKSKFTRNGAFTSS